MKIHTLLHRFVRSRPHLSLAIALGVALGLALPDTLRPIVRALLGWNVTVWGYLIAMLPIVTRADHAKVRRVAAAQDESADRKSVV